MKTYIQGIIFGILAILCGLLFIGIPFGTGIIEIANVIVLILGAIAVLTIGIFLKKHTASLIIAAVYMVILFILTMIIENGTGDFTIVGIGFIPGSSMAITGLVTSTKQKGSKKVLAAIILNVVGILIGIASLVIAAMNGALS